MVHPAGDDPRPVQVEVGAEDLVPVALHAAEYCDIVFSLEEAVKFKYRIEDRETNNGRSPVTILKLTAFP